MFRWFLIGSLCVIGLVIDLACAEPVKTATVDQLLLRENIGQTIIDDERGKIYFEFVRSAGDTPVLQSYNAWRNGDARSHLYAASLDGSLEAAPLFFQSEDAGYVLAGAGRVSPDGRYLAIYRLCEGTMAPGVYDLNRDEARFFDISVPQAPSGSSFRWISSTRFTHQVEASEFPISNYPVTGTRAEAAAREAGWRDRQVTADLVGAGRYDTGTQLIDSPSFVAVDVESGAVTLLEEASREFVKTSENSEVTPTVEPPTEQSELLAFTDAGAVFRANDYATGSHLVYVPGEGDAKTLFTFNTHLAGVTPASDPIPIHHKDYAGEAAIGWLYLPPGASTDEPRQHPLVVIPYPGAVHGERSPREAGSSRSADTIWDVDLGTTTYIEVFAAHGYAVLLPSVPLGPTGEPGEPMTRMMPAILSALDGAIVSGHVDPERLALSGHSYGGYGALSVATQTGRFDAIIAMSVIANLTSKFGQFIPGMRVGIVHNPLFLRSIGNGWSSAGQSRMGAPPWEDPKRYIRNSPLLFADKVETPVMIIHGDIDTATFITQAEEIFTALRREEKDALFLRYWGEGHDIKQPQNQRDMWDRIFNFLEGNGVTPGPKLVH